MWGGAESRDYLTQPGNGLFFRDVEHTGNGQISWEEARALAAATEELLGTPYTGDDGVTRPLAEHDVLVVTPYNAQVRALRRTVPDGIRVGTVDKLQGQEAPVVLVSLASSSSEEARPAVSRSSSTRTGSTSPHPVPSAASSSSARRGCSRRTEEPASIEDRDPDELAAGVPAEVVSLGRLVEIDGCARLATWR